MKELRLKYNNKEELQSLVKAVEAYIDNQAKLNNQTYGFKSLRIIVVEELKTGMKLDIAVRTTKTGIVVAKVLKKGKE